MGGFEVLVQVAEHNAKAFEEALDDLDHPMREGIRVEDWRALPDSPGDQPQ